MKTIIDINPQMGANYESTCQDIHAAIKTIWSQIQDLKVSGTVATTASTMSTMVGSLITVIWYMLHLTYMFDNAN